MNTDLLTETADRLAIQELANHFENTFDFGLADDHMAVWAENMTFDSPFGTYEGKPAYRQWLEGFMQVTQQNGGTRHLITNFVTHVQGDEATMLCYLIILSPKTRSILATTYFNDKLAKIDGHWKFTRRELHIDQDMTVLATVF